MSVYMEIVNKSVVACLSRLCCLYRIPYTKVSSVFVTNFSRWTFSLDTKASSQFLLHSLTMFPSTPPSSNQDTAPNHYRTTSFLYRLRSNPVIVSAL
ncbi:hypothetical protein AVEN_122414-1 [Araneus ventricosus]|uniref:Uncharacterized protein n=1 Tax=Araneus ventricosus TaxID=182803 RepID=A0A4Y2K0E0_ARAVE|nr:hypothetical protein AVEN_122414-1 [Araneus ventricosus]